MSANLTTRLYQTRVRRLAVGIGISMAIAFGVGWPLAFMSPMLVASFLAAPTPRPPLIALIAMPLMILGGFLLALGIASVGLSTPLLAILTVSLLIFRCFYQLAQGRNKMFLMWALIGILIIPVVSLDSMTVGLYLTIAIFKSGVIAMAFVWLAHVLVPDPPEAVAAAAKKPMPKVDPWAAAKFAFIRTLMLLPLVSWILFTQGTDKVKILIFSAILALSPGLDAGGKGKGLVVSNLVAGFVSLVVYEALVLCPSIVFLVLLFVFLALFCGRQIFGGGKWAQLCASGFGTVILLTGLGTMPVGGDVDEQFYTRILQLLAAAIYMQFAYRVAGYVLQRKARRHEGRMAAATG